MAVSSIIYLIITRVVLGGKTLLEQFGGVLLVLFIVFASLALAYVGFNEDLKERKQKVNPMLENELTNKPDTAKLLEEKLYEPVSSVTEDTTEIFAVENKTSKL